MSRARHVLLLIDDAEWVRRDHPVMFARASTRGATCQELSEWYSLWRHGYAGLPSWLGAFNATPSTLRRANKRHAAKKASR